jgi:hypothetical protein
MNPKCCSTIPNGCVVFALTMLTASILARPMDLCSPNLEATAMKHVPTLIVPIGAEQLLSRNCVVLSSTSEPEIGELRCITDGNKDASESDNDNMVKLATGLQWVQLDLGVTQAVYGVCIWRHHKIPRIYRDVVVQLSNEPSFTKGVTTLFNNDHDNSSGLGLGTDKEYIEDHLGRCIPVVGIPTRYIRVYSNGYYSEGGIINPDSANYYTEIEVYGGVSTTQETTTLVIDIPRPQFL